MGWVGSRSGLVGRPLLLRCAGDRTASSSSAHAQFWAAFFAEPLLAGEGERERFIPAAMPTADAAIPIHDDPASADTGEALELDGLHSSLEMLMALWRLFELLVREKRGELWRLPSLV